MKRIMSVDDRMLRFSHSRQKSFNLGGYSRGEVMTLPDTRVTCRKEFFSCRPGAFGWPPILGNLRKFGRGNGKSGHFSKT